MAPQAAVWAAPVALSCGLCIVAVVVVLTSVARQSGCVWCWFPFVRSMLWRPICAGGWR